MKTLWWAGLFWYLATAFTNLGIIATDDYEFGIARIIPAQNWNFLRIISASGNRSPFANLYLFAFTKTALIFGINDPATQLKFALALSGAISYGILSYVSLLWGGPLLLFFIAFYFICPMAYTRPLIESLSAPWVFLSAYFAYRYERISRHRDILISLFSLMIAAMFRFQTGVCALALLLLVLHKKDTRGLALLAVGGAMAFLFSGMIDFIWKGSLHYSLFAYTKYQAAEISNFGKQPFYVFIGLFLLLSFPPALFRKFHGFSWNTAYRPLLAPLLYFFIFLVSHSMITHKEERFMIPVLAIFFVLLLPLIRETYLSSPNGWRVKYFLGLNFLLLPFASFNSPQNNLIATARYIHTYPEIKSVKQVDHALFNFPVAFIGHEVHKSDMSMEDIKNGVAIGCDAAFAVREDVRETFPNIKDHYHRLGVFEPGVLERIVIYLNPKQNSRRRALELFRDKGCP